MKKSLLAILALIFTLSAECKRPVYLYAHGLADTANQAFNYKGVLFDQKEIPLTFNFPDATTQFWRVNIAEANLGQTEDINSLACEYYKELEDDPEAEFVGIGVSRGATTWLSFMGMHGYDQVKALILESPFDSVASLPNHKLIPFIMLKYDPLGIQPRDNIAKIPKDLPILIVCVKNDRRVPASSTVEVYSLLRESGHKNVHILAFESGEHGKFVLGDNTDTYTNVAQAFYKKYGLPYNKQAAKAGKKLFKKTQPEPEDLL